MNRVKFILLLQLVTLTLCKLNNNQNDNKTKFLPPNKIYKIFFGKSIPEVEKSVKSFVLSLSIPLERSLYQNFQKSSFENNFKKSVNIFTKVIIENLHNLQRSLRIYKKSGLNNITISESGRNESVKSNLIQNGLIVATELSDIVSKSIKIGTRFLSGNRYFIDKFFKSNKWRKAQFMDFFIYANKLFIYVKCVANDTNIKKAIRYLSSHSSNEVSKYLEKNLEKPPKSKFLNVTHYICYSLQNIIPGGYEKCIYDLNNVYSCTRYQFPIQSLQEPKSGEFLKKMKQLFPRKWVKSIKVLEPRCKLKKNQQFECNFSGKRLKGTKNRVRYIIENFIGKQVRNGSSLLRIINRFSGIVSRNKITKNLVRSCCDYITIWRKGLKRMEKLKKKSIGNSEVSKEYKKVSRSFYNYKNGLVKDLLNSIIAFNQIPIYLENSMEKAFSQKAKPTLYGSMISYLSGLFRALFEFNKRRYDVTDRKNLHSKIEYHKKSRGLIQIQEEFPDLKLEIPPEQAINNLVKEMNQISNSNRNLSRKSTFTGGLTNILLALMFLETLSAVTLLMSQNINIHQANEQIPVEIDEIPEVEESTEANEIYEENNEQDNEEESDEEDQTQLSQHTSLGRKRKSVYLNS